MPDLWSLVKGRLRRQSGLPLTTWLKQDSAYVAQAAWARVWLKDCDAVGQWVRTIEGRPRVRNEGRIDIGERTRLFSRFAPIELVTGPEGSLVIGERCSINFGVLLDASVRVTIGNDVDIGPYSIVSDTETPESNGLRAGRAKPIEIGDGVWLASRVTVLPGSRIGAGSVITAGSIVSGEIPPRVVAGGAPARVLRKLDDGEAGPNAAAERDGAHGSSSTVVAAPVPSAAPEPAYRGLLISDFTIDELARALETDPTAPRLGAELAPFGQVVATLMSPPPAGLDYAVVWTRPEAALPSFARVLQLESVSDADLLAEVDQFANLVAEGLRSYRFGVVPTWTLPPWQRGHGILDARGGGATRALHLVNSRLMERLATVPNVFVMSAARWVDAAGKGAHSPKLWYMGKVPFTPAVFKEAALDIKAATLGLGGMARKLCVVDLDDTMWGGIVGDVGYENLRLGGHDSVGEAFVDFQRALKNLKRRGILLAIVSKNEESVALEAIRKHPAMILREEDFVAHRINWKDKATNIADLTASLRLGLQSVVFIDDNPFERARVRETLAEVFVPEWPEDKLLYPSALLSLRCFDAPALSAEDAARTEMYAVEKQREDLRTNVGSVDAWLKSLEIRVHVEPLGRANLARTAQLLNKTNQMNLSTRRLTEAELEEWVRRDGRWLRAISVSDRLGDSGLTGIVSLEADGGTAKVVDFVLSCRVMGRKIEETMMHLAIEEARRLSLSRVVATLVPTPKNKPCLGFFEGSGLKREESSRFEWDATERYPLPEAISVEFRG